MAKSKHLQVLLVPPQPKQLVVDFGCEWPIDPITRAPGKLGTVQIAVNNTVDIYCVGHVDTLSQPLIDVLSNSHIVKMGRVVQQDLKKVERDFRISCDGGYDFGTSPALANAVLADYRLRHNIDVYTRSFMLKRKLNISLFCLYLH